MITEKSLIKAIGGRDEYLDAIIIRTLPNNLESASLLLVNPYQDQSE